MAHAQVDLAASMGARRGLCRIVLLCCFAHCWFSVLADRDAAMHAILMKGCLCEGRLQLAGIANSNAAQVWSPRAPKGLGAEAQTKSPSSNIAFHMNNEAVSSKEHSDVMNRLLSSEDAARRSDADADDLRARLHATKTLPKGVLRTWKHCSSFCRNLLVHLQSCPSARMIDWKSSCRGSLAQISLKQFRSHALHP